VIENVRKGDIREKVADSEYEGAKGLRFFEEKA